MMVLDLFELWVIFFDLNFFDAFHLKDSWQGASTQKVKLILLIAQKPLICRNIIEFLRQVFRSNDILRLFMTMFAHAANIL